MTDCPKHGDAGIGLLLMGGLGNRTFIRAAANLLSLSSCCSVSLYADDSRPDSSFSEVALLKGHSVPIRNLSELPKSQLLAVSTCRLLSHLTGGGAVTIGGVWATERSRVSILDIPKSATFCAAYFQLVSEMADSIRDLLLSGIVKAGKPHIKGLGQRSQEQSVTLHVRGGDFVASSKHELLDLGYYSEALRALNKSLLSNVVILNNDLVRAHEVKSYLQEVCGVRAKFYLENQDFRFTETEALCFMAYSKHLVTSNSTLSKVAGILAESLGAESIVGYEFPNDAGPIPYSWHRISASRGKKIR